MDALRETREETGLRGRPLAPLGEILYVPWSRSDSMRPAKHVTPLGSGAGSRRLEDPEAEGVRPVPVARRWATLTYAGERQVMQRAVARLEGAASGPGRLEEIRGCTP